MAEQAKSEPITIVLSRDELLAVLDAIAVETIPGIDVEPTGDWTERDRAVAKLVASRSLMARGLARRDEDGKLSLHTDLLTAVGVCAHSQSAAFVFHWSEKSVAPVRTFGHVAGVQLVLHARPTEAMHIFTIMPSRTEFVTQILAYCGMSAGDVTFPDEDVRAEHEFRVPSQLLTKVSQATSVADASNLLTSLGVEPHSAQALATDLIEPSRISILQTIQQTDAETVMKRDFTLMETERHSWLMAAESPIDDTLPLLIKTTTRDELSRLLDRWI